MRSLVLGQIFLIGILLDLVSILADPDRYSMLILNPRNNSCMGSRDVSVSVALSGNTFEHCSEATIKLQVDVSALKAISSRMHHTWKFSDANTFSRLNILSRVKAAVVESFPTNLCRHKQSS